MSQVLLSSQADDLLLAAVALRQAAEEPGASASFSSLTSSLKEALRLLSASVCRLADDAVPTRAERHRLGPTVRVDPVTGLSREQEVQLVSTLHDLAASFDHCAASCERTAEIAVPLIVPHAVEA